MRYLLIFSLLVLQHSAFSQDNRVKINLHSGGYFFGWKWFNKSYNSANNNAQSTAIINGFDIEVPFKSIKERYQISSIIGYRNIYSEHFVKLEQEGMFIFHNPYKNYTHYINAGLQVMYFKNEKYGFGSNVDFLYFIEPEFDIHNQKRFAANLDLLFRKKLSSNFFLGIKSPIRILPYAEWKGSNSIQFDEDGYNPGAGLTPYHVRIGAIGISLTLTYSLF